MKNLHNSELLKLNLIGDLNTDPPGSETLTPLSLLFPPRGEKHLILQTKSHTTAALSFNG